ncbi:hypothetical protein D187_003545 [Cystobacter fuscus DSM 2262]|uniref:LTD domain-containing protein n=1 Tax=Cystobacter fuscus (strain ATCC 25194 / DSM 2262 / NBRC 100088 / M29) TaxID=1242864 RepID=S9P2Y7_CYSF2|nr:lamin tail domain-containing protein [Cystobacter fuscus]EPX58830.1 hypothetical protein D187_003545 [Cystobacter fuscus DSM 2262]
MKHAPPSLARLVAWSALLLGLSLGGSACRDEPNPPPPPVREMPDAERSSVEVNPARGVRANGQDTVEIRVTVRTADGTPLEGRAVTVEASGEGNTLGQPSGPTDAQGVAVATLASTSAGTKTVTATVDAEGGPVTLASRPTVEFVSLAAPHLVFTGAPSSGTAGKPLGTFEVTIQDASGQTVTDASDTVTVALGEGSPSAELKGTVSVAAVNGVARFSTLVLEKAAAGYTLVASAAGLASATSSPFEVLPAPAAPTKLVFTQQPSNRGAGETFEVRVAVTDASGNRLSVSAPRVTLALNKGTLAGTTSVDPVDGVASFPGLSITEAGTGYVLTASAEGLDSASSDSFDIASTGTPAMLVFRTQPTSAKVREVMPAVTVAITDEFGNVLSVDSPDVTLGLVGGNNAAELLGTVTVKPVAGLATFSTLSVDQQGTDFWLVAMAGTLDSATSGKFTIVDDVAPSAVSLTVAELTANAVTLAWTAVGDDGTLGIASSYELRYSLSPITEASFEAATPVSVGVPKDPGSAESARVTGLVRATHYYFGLKVRDDVGNSSLSLVDTTTPEDVCAGVTCAPDAPVCAADGVSRTTYTAACVDENGTGTCKRTETTTACTGASAVCFNAQCDTAPKPTANQLLVSEVMHSPSSGTTEYVELTNATDGLLNLNGLTVTYKNSSDAVRSFQVGSGSTPLVVGRKGHFVLAQNKDRATNGGVSASYQYPSAIALEGSGSFIVANGASTVTEFRYTPSFPQSTGKSMNLSSLVQGTRAAAQPWYWCDSTDALSGGDYGTPEAANTACGMTASPVVSLCYIQSPKTIPPTQAGTPVTVSSRFKATSVTDRNTAGNDGYPYVVAELGYGPDTSPAPDWTWTTISFNGAYAPTVSDEDETLGTLSISTPGSYKYGFRYSFKDPVTGAQSAYVYCGVSDISDPTNGVFGTVTITVPPAPMTDHVVISEFASKNAVAGSTDPNHDDEFIELYNPTNAAVALTGWKIQYASPTGGFNNLAGLTSLGSIPAKGFYLIALKDKFTGPTPDATYTGLTGHNGGGLRILDAAGKVVDLLGWGTASAANREGTAAPAIDNAQAGSSIERKSVASSTADTMKPGGGDALRGNGYDSDNNGSDFVVRATRDPQNSSSAPESP